jgi:predicted TIM-barrel fold metal-dependent hydrolase
MARAQVPEVPLVDTHFHVYTRDMPMAGDAWHKPTEDAPIERMIQTLDQHGVLFGVMAAASMYGDYNDYTALAMKQHKRLRGTAIVRPDTDIRILRQMRDEGFVGIRFQWRYLKTLPDLSAPDYRLLLRRVNDLGWHVHLHDNSSRLGPVIEQLENAGVRLVIDHFGRPDPKLGVNCPGFKAILRSIEKGNTWAKLSAGFRFEPPELAKDYAAALLKVAGGERLMWGSDWPFAAFESKVRYADTIVAFAAWVPDEKLRRQIGGATPLQFYFT